jgi:PPM family protein phosphatase
MARTQTTSMATGPTAIDAAPESSVSARGAQALVVRSSGLTDCGKVRPDNQDQFLIAALARALWIQQSSLQQSAVQYADAQGQMLVVADGMGGHAGGAQASSIALGAIEDFLLNTLKWLFALGEPEEAGPIDALEELKGALRRADAQICEEAAHHPELRGMGTTVTMAYSHGSDLFIAHVGDSRCYLLREGALHQLTRDHTLVQEMVESGIIPAEVAAHHDLRHVITNVVGGPAPGIKAEVHKIHLEAGDVVLLCTDGLTDMLSDEQIAAVLMSEHSPRAACAALVRRANEGGGRDNVTAVVARYDHPAEKSPL